MMLCYLNRCGTSILDDIIQYNIKPEWFDDPLIREAMSVIEHVNKIEGLAFYSTDHGVKSPQSLSNGMKSMLIMRYIPADSKYFPNEKFVTSACIGDNLAPFIQRMSLEHDFPVAIDCWVDYDMYSPILAKDMDTGEIFTDTREFQLHWSGRYEY